MIASALPSMISATGVRVVIIRSSVPMECSLASDQPVRKMPMFQIIESAAPTNT